MKAKILIGLILIINSSYFLFIYQSPPTVESATAQNSASIPYPPEYNYKQTINDCGPFNVAAVVRAITEKDVDSSKFADEIEWRLPNKYTLPWGLEKQLKENGITTETPNLSPLDNEKKIIYLKNSLYAQNPIILLGKQDNFQHYITLLGYENDNFHTYNPLYNDDENGESPGNRDLSTGELLEFWEGGGMYGVYKWYAIVSS
jgi:hypothetical protein